MLREILDVIEPGEDNGDRKQHLYPSSASAVIVSNGTRRNIGACIPKSCPSTCKHKRYGLSLSLWAYIKGSRLLDLSNIVKAIEDALNGVVYHDDNQIIELSRCVKIYDAEEEKLVVRISEVDNVLTEDGTPMPIARTYKHKVNEAIEFVRKSDNQKWLSMMLQADKRKTVRRAIEERLTEVGEEGRGRHHEADKH